MQVSSSIQIASTTLYVNVTVCIYAYAQYVIFFMFTLFVIPFMLNLYGQLHFLYDTIPLSLSHLSVTLFHTYIQYL